MMEPVVKVIALTFHHMSCKIRSFNASLFIFTFQVNHIDKLPLYIIMLYIFSPVNSNYYPKKV